MAQIPPLPSRPFEDWWYLEERFEWKAERGGREGATTRDHPILVTQ